MDNQIIHTHIPIEYNLETKQLYYDNCQMYPNKIPLGDGANVAMLHATLVDEFVSQELLSIEDKEG